MVNLANEERNREIVLRRLEDKKKWTWGKLGRHYNLERNTVKDIFERDLDKYRPESSK